MNRYILSYFVLVLAMSFNQGCKSDLSTDEVVEYDSFHNEYLLNAEIVDWMDLWNCYNLRIYDSLLVAIDWKRPDGFLRVFNLRTKKQIGAFGDVGKGPGEYQRSPRLTPAYIYENGDLIIQFDNRGRVIQNINLSQSVKQNRIIEHSKLELPDDKWVSSPFFFNSKLYSADSSVLKVDYISTGERFISHDPINGCTDINLPSLPIRASLRKGMIYQGKAKCHKNGGRS